MNLKLLKIERFFHLISKKDYNEKRQIEIVKNSPLFDAKWYLAQNPDVKAKKIGAVKHYVKHGWKEGRNPSPNFDNDEYLKSTPELRAKGWCPVFHYMLEHKELVPKVSYREEILKRVDKAKLKLADKCAKKGIKLKFLNKYEGKSKDYVLIAESKYFNKRWYLKQYPDVKKAGVDPVEHYMKYGWKEGRNPSQEFDTKGYLARYNDVKNAKVNPLLHYLKYGMKEGRINYVEYGNFIIKILKYLNCSCGNKSKKRILFVSHEMTYTGAPLSLLQSVSCFLNKGYKVKVVSLSSGELEKEFEKLGVEVKIIKTKNSNSLLFYSIGCDIAIVNTLVPYVEYNLLSKIMPTIWWVRESPVLLERNSKMRDIFSKGKNIYTMSEYSRNEFLPYNPNIDVIKHGMEDLYEGKDVYLDKIRFAVIGTISPRKGQDILIESIKKLDRKYQNLAEFYIIGKSLNAKIYDEIIQVSKLYPNIIVMDEIKETTEMLRYYENLTCIIVPSREEPTSRVAIEAMMMGRPVIMSNKVGAQYLLNEGKNGYMFENENSEQLAKIIEGIIDNPDKLKNMSEEARKAYLQNNSMSVLTNNLVKMVEKIDSKSSGSKKSDIGYIEKSKYFDKKWYLQQYKDVQKAGIDPAKHYLNNGWKEGRNPSSLFSTKDYLEKYSDVQRANICPLLHYEKNGKKEGRSPRPKTYSYYSSLPVWKYADELKLWFKQQTGQDLNLDNPQTYNEKMQWLKLYDSTPIKTRLADKYLVRDWVKEKIGEEYLIPLLGVYDKFEEIDFNKLPNKFVIKCNHGSGWNIIVKDKTQLDLVDVKNKLDTWMQRNFAFQFGFELQYRDMQPKIIIEEYIDPAISAHEIQAWVFNNEIKFISVETIKDIKNLERGTFYPDGTSTDFDVSPQHYKKMDKIFSREAFDEVINVAKKMTIDVPYVRIDFIEYKGGIKFREMTFTSGSGLSQIEPKEAAIKLGYWIKLPKLAYNIDTKEYVRQEDCYLPKVIDIKKILNKKVVPDTRKLKLSIIVPIYNAVKDVENCLNSLLESGLSKSTEVLLMDDCSNIETRKYLQKFVKNHSQFKLYTNNKNLGFIKNCNRGMSLAKKDVVVLLNSDTKVPVGFDETVLECFASDKNIAIASPLSTHSGLFNISENKKYNLNRINKIVQKNSKKEYPLITPEGFCFAIRKEIISKIGALDEIFGIGYCEEDDMVMRALEYGYKTVLIDNLIVYHKSHASFTSETREKILKKNILIFRRRWSNMQAIIREQMAMMNKVKSVNDFYNKLVGNL